MKKHYKRRPDEPRWSRWSNTYLPAWGVGRFEHKYARHYRTFQTFNEIRQHEHALLDGAHIRARRLNLPRIWDDCHIGRNYGRSWKDFTKNRRQWDCL